MSAAAPASRSGKYLTFILSGEQYCIDIRTVNSIQSMRPIVPLPQTPHYVRGVTNLRGKIIPVINTRTKFGMPEIEPTGETGIIILDVGEKQIGILVDSVKEVVDIDESMIAPPPSFGDGGIGSEMISGLCRMGEQVKIMLNVEKMLSDDVSALSGAFGGSLPAGVSLDPNMSAEELIPL